MLKFLRLTAAPSVALLVLIAGCSTEQPQVISPAPTPTPSLSTQTAASPIASDAPSLSPQTDPFQEANDKAIGLANISRTAQSEHDWNSIAVGWQELIDLMKAVPTSSPNYALAQKKVIEYQRNLAMAKQNSNKPFKVRSEETQITTQQASNITSNPVEAPKSTARTQQASNITSSPVEAPKSTARDFIENYLKYITTKGGTWSGAGYSCKEAQDLSSSLFSPRSYQILDISEYSAKDGNPEATATVRIDSSNKGGEQITADWDFYMKKGPAVVDGLPGGWCIEIMNKG